MTQEINVAGTPSTAPRTVAESADKKSTAKLVSSKVMVLAVHLDAAGEVTITPIDIEHENDDQRDLSGVEKVAKKNLRDVYAANEAAMKKGLGAMFEIFAQRLYREQFRTFENFCFTIFGAHRIGDITATKAKAKVKKLRTELEEDKV